MVDIVIKVKNGQSILGILINGFFKKQTLKGSFFASNLIEEFLERTHKRMGKWDRYGRVPKQSMVSCKIQQKLN